MQRPRFALHVLVVGLLSACADGALPPPGANDPTNPNAAETPMTAAPALSESAAAPPANAAPPPMDHAHMHHHHAAGSMQDGGS